MAVGRRGAVPAARRRNPTAACAMPLGEARCAARGRDRPSDLDRHATTRPTPRQPASRRWNTQEHHMISNLLTTDLVLADIDSAERDDVIAALAQRLAAYHADVDGERLVVALRERERQVSTS